MEARCAVRGLAAGLVLAAIAAGCGEGRGALLARAPSAPTRLLSEGDPGDLGGDEATVPPASGAGPARAVSLTASDGTGLSLARTSIRVALADPFALTELHLSFENPTDRTLEGTFRWALPERATLARFAMRVGDALAEGEVVPRRDARTVYEDVLHRRDDPALLEPGAGNAWSARIFPIRPHETKELVLAYSETLPSHADYTVHLGALPLAGPLDAVAYQGGRVAAELRTSAPPADWTVAVGARRDGVRAGDLALVRVALPIQTEPELPSSVVVLVDTSASRHGTLARSADALDVLARRVAQRADGWMTILAFDQTRATIFRGPASTYDAKRVREGLGRRGALGASSLAEALGAAADLARETMATRVVFFGDGIATAGPGGEALAARAKAALASAGVRRVDVVRGGGVRDDALLASLAEGGVAVDEALPAETVVDRLLTRVEPARAIRVDGARAVFPERAPPGEREVTVIAEMSGPAPERLTVHVGDEPRTIPLAAGDGRLLGRAHAARRIERLLHGPGAGDEIVQREVVALSVAHRVPSPLTSMLVLESDAAYTRYGIDRASPAPILVVEPSGASVLPRRKPSVPEPGPAPADPDGPEGRWGGGLELSSSAVGHLWGTAHGAGTAPRLRSPATTPAPTPPLTLPPSGTVAPSKAAVSGRLAPEVIQRVVRSKQRELRLCFERALRRDPSVGGRLTLHFTMTPSGAPSDVVVEGPLPIEMRACVADVLRSMRFAPSPGPAHVVYPIAFVSEDGARMWVGPATPPPEPLPHAPPRTTPPRAFVGRIAPIMELLERGATRDALRAAMAWHDEAPSDVLALVVLGEALAASGRPAAAARAFGSIVDLYPARADLVRHAGERLEALGDPHALAMAIDAFARAALDRPEHPSSHRLLAFALARTGALDHAFDVIERGAGQRYAEGRFGGAAQILREDAGLIGAAWARVAPGRRREIERRLASIGASLEDGPSLRFVLMWESDESDLDLHVVDGTGDHAFFGQRTLLSGGELYADVTTGYGPEGFVVRKDRAARDAAAGGYRLRAQYFARGPQGYGMGKLEVVEHDGQGRLTFDERPVLLMEDGATMDLGSAR